MISLIDDFAARIQTERQLARFYLDPHPEDLNTAEVARLLGNRVLLFRDEADMKRLPSGLFFRDTYGIGSMLHKVLAVGPGTWVKQPMKHKRWRWIWITPDCERGDIVISDHWTSASEHPHWHPPRFLDDAGGRGRVIVDARFIWMKYNPQTKRTNERSKSP